jgi:hypothetical protein
MWKRNHSITVTTVSKEQLWKLFADVNSWHTWDEGIEYTQMDGPFKKGTQFTLKPKGGPKVKVELTDVQEPWTFTDVTYFPLAKMYDAHVFEDTPNGLKITNTITVTGLLGFLWVKLVAQNIVASLPLDMQKQVAAAAKL